MSQGSSTTTVRLRKVLWSQKENKENLANDNMSILQTPLSHNGEPAKAKTVHFMSEAPQQTLGAKSMPTTPLCSRLPLRPGSVRVGEGRGVDCREGRGAEDKGDTACAKLNMQSLKMELEARLEGRTPSVVDLVDKTSPGLAKLRETPRGTLQTKQQRLTEKHNEARRNTDRLSIGGGVSCWPEMHSMRLTPRETIQLILTSFSLMTAVVFLFFQVHYQSLQDLMSFLTRLETFSSSHTISLHQDQKAFHTSLLAWHRHLRLIMRELQEALGFSRPSGTRWLYGAGYLAGLGTLVYFLADNVCAPARLTPRRIKHWVSLLVVVGTWTALLLYWLLLASTLESVIEGTVLHMASLLGDLVESGLELERYSWVLQYWQICCLPPTSRGVVTLGGLLGVRDLVFYLQYYAVPIATVLLTPVFRLIVALYNIYWPAKP